MPMALLVTAFILAQGAGTGAGPGNSGMGSAAGPGAMTVPANPGNEELTQALDTLSIGADESAEAAAKRLLLDASETAGGWHDYYASFFETRAYTPGLANFWNNWVNTPGEAQMDAAIASGVCVAEALGATLRRQPLDAAAALAALDWLDYLASGLDARGMEAVTASCTLAFASSRLDIAALMGLAPAQQPEPPGPRTEPRSPAAPAADQPGAAAPPAAVADTAPPTEEQLRVAMQTCLTLSRFHGTAQLREWLALPADLERFASKTGILLFDRGLMTPAHLESLDSLCRSFPETMRPAGALLVPDSMGMPTQAWGLSSMANILDIAAIPMQQLSSPEEFTARTGAAVAPEFTLEAAAQSIAALQYIAFNQRPQLAVLRDNLLFSAGNHSERYLRRNVNPGFFLDNPDALLPAVGYLWMLNSGHAFAMARNLLKIGQPQPMTSLLLLADVLSGGTDSTLVFTTSEDGVVSSAPAAIRRAMAPPGIVAVDAIAINGQLVEFNLDEGGIIGRGINASEYWGGEGENDPFAAPDTQQPFGAGENIQENNGWGSGW